MLAFSRYFIAELLNFLSLKANVAAFTHV